MSHFPASQTRSHVAPNFAVLAPESHVPAAIAGWVNAQAVILIAPRSGAKFAEYFVTLTTGAASAAPPKGASRFVYVLEGVLTLATESATHALLPGGYAYLPPDMPHMLGTETQVRIAVVEKPYVGTPHANRPDAVIIGREQDVATKPVGGDADVFVKNLLPDLPGFDMAMNIMAFKPGAALSLVEVHVMEHGLLMLDGTLLYRLDDAYFPVQTGDVIYMAPFCPQWCAAFGKQTARYLLYKDWNRAAFEYLNAHRPKRFDTTPRMKKGQLPKKQCQTCGRDFEWRKKWARDWEQVRYCSERCQRAAKRQRGGGVGG